MTDGLCGICMKPILDGEAIYTIPDANGRVRHYECWEEHNPIKQLRKSLEDLQKTAGKISNIVGRPRARKK